MAMNGLFRRHRATASALAGLALFAMAPGQAAAQQAEAAAAAPADEPVDPARLAAARPVVEKLWPTGTYRRMMDGAMTGMMQQMMDKMFDMPASDFARMGGASDSAVEATEGKSLGELASMADPHIRERTRIATDVMFKEMIPLVERLEPGIRDSLGRIYARKYSAEQLAELDRFFSTPTGQTFAADFMITFVDPELVSQMQAFVPELMGAMPGILARIEAATAHLPPPPKRERPTSE
jgi:hypothetical protein